MVNRIVVFTDSRSPFRGFEAFAASSKWELVAEKPGNLRKVLKKSDELSIYALDLSAVADKDKIKDLKYLLKKDNVLRAVIDRKREVSDPAELLMKGCDYYGADLLKEGIRPARINSYESWIISIKPDPQEQPVPVPPDGCTELKTVKDPFIPVKNGWNDIKSGKEYSFYMLFAEFSIPSDWKKKSGSVHLNELKQIFQTVAERASAPLDGRVWIWSEYGGLILFPYTGKTCSPVISAVNLLLNRVLFSIEDFGLHAPIHIRASMHLGTTAWKARGDTGTIISDSINSIFHLGTKYTPPDNLDITREVYERMLPRLQGLFEEAGTFEDRKIYRLRSFEVIN